MTKLFYISFFSFTLFSCKAQTNNKVQYDVRSDIRLSTKFYSIYLNKEGQACVIKGNGSYYTDTLIIVTSDTSNVFKIDSVNLFFEKLNKIKANPIIGENRLHAPRVEIYYDHQKVYDAYRWDETFWGLFRPIMEQIPKGFNPFRESDKPFTD